MASDSESETSEETDPQPSTSTANPSIRNKSIHSSFRRSDISSTSIQEELDLGELGIEAYDQTTYERRVFEQVDEAISHVGAPSQNNNASNRPDLLNLIQTSENQQPGDDEVQGTHVDNDERVLQLARLERNRLNIKRENTSPSRDEHPKLPKIPRLSNRDNEQPVRVKSEPIYEDYQPSTSAGVPQLWTPSILFKTEHVKKEEIDDHAGIREESESDDEEEEDDLHLDEDIDYETDEDLSPPKKSREPSKKLRKLKKVVDDGDPDYYKKRIKDYIKERAKSRLDSINEDGVETNQIDELITVEGQLQIPKVMWDGLFEHQKTGVKWLWELHQLGSGGILGDEMGLGKTIQTIAFLTALRKSNIPTTHKGYDHLGPTVLVCPATVMYQWLLEFRKWWPPFRVAILHSTGTYTGDYRKLVSSINKSQGILIVSYPGVVIYQDILHAFDWHYAILDEGHKIRNPDAQITLACKRFRTPHRIILSGSPVQNNLKELWSIFDFIYPGKLGTLPVFMQQFATPITQGGYANASDIQVQIGYKCSCVLRDTIKPFLLRRTKSEVNNKLKLPERSEQVLFCKLTDRQYELYDNYLKSPTIRDIKAGLLQIFVGLTQLRKICNHPDLFDTPTTTNNNNNNNKNNHLGNNGERSRRSQNHDPCDLNSNRLNDLSSGCYKRSGKMMVVDALLKIWRKQGHKVLLFTQSRKMLRIFQKYLDELDYKYLSMDGTTSIGLRQSTIDQFNNTQEIFIFLLTTRVGGVGINLVGANRIIIFDPDWNPSTDIQARERAWRIGQKKQVIIYRLLTAGTIEEKIYHRQVFKLYLTNRILRDAKQKRFFKTNDLHELFTLGDNEKNIETKALFDDDLQINPDDLKNQAKERKKREKLIAKEERKSQKKQMKLAKHQMKLKQLSENRNGEIKLSEEKLEAMRERAKRLSQMIASQYGKNNDKNNAADEPSKSASTSTSTSKSAPVASVGDNLFLAGLYRNNNDNDRNNTRDKDSKASAPKQTLVREPVKYLVRQDIYRGGEASKEATQKQKNADEQQQQEDYILDTLFKSSNVFGALKHDKIESDSTSDFKVVESEAEKVARDAIRVLRESRRMCMGSLSGVPNWTGRNGQLGAPARQSVHDTFGRTQAPARLVPKNKSRAQQFLQRIGNGEVATSSRVITTTTTVNQNSSGSLLNSIKKRTQKTPIQLARDIFGVGPPSDEVDEQEEEEESRRNNICQGRAEGTGADKMADMLRDYMLHKSASGTGDVPTDELLEFFNSSGFKPEETAIFKALLYKVCTFKRFGDKGFWTIKSEFKDQ